MFFTPILSLLSKNKENENVKIYLICLSTGDAHGLGKVRIKELYKSCALFNIIHVEIIDEPLLQDGINNVWDHNIIIQYLEDEIKKYNIHIIITFDNYGISGHLNHIAVAEATQYLLKRHKEIEGLQLVSVPLWRKYLGILDYIFSFNDKYYIFNITYIISAWHGMTAHRSQFVWFRILHILFSRYTYMNSLSPIQS